MDMSFLSIFLMMFAGGGIGNDLLDFVPADAYFKAVGIEMSVEALTEVLDAPVPEEAELRPGDSARRQLALRALGKLKDKAALAVIEKHLVSTDPLVADYARAARAALAGEAYRRPAPGREKLGQDLACLPSGVGVVGRLSVTADGGGGGMVKKMTDLVSDFRAGGGVGELDEEQMKEMEAEMVREIGKVISMLGNVRLGAVTFAVSSELGGVQGFFVALARGHYDHEAFAKMLEKKADAPRVEAGGLVFHEIGHGSGYVAPVSDELLVFAVGASREEIPLAEVGEKVLAGGGDFAIGKDLAMLLDRADTAAPIWALMKVTDAYKKAPFLAPFDTVTMQGKAVAAGKTDVKIEAKGDDPEAVAEVVAKLNDGLKKAREELAREAAEFPPAEMFGKMLETVTIAADGVTTSMSAQLPEGGAMALLPMMSLGRAVSIPAPDDPAPEPPQVEEAPERVVPE